MYFYVRNLCSCIYIVNLVLFCCVSRGSESEVCQYTEYKGFAKSLIAWKHRALLDHYCDRMTVYAHCFLTFGRCVICLLF